MPVQAPERAVEAHFAPSDGKYTPKGKNGWNRLKTGLRRSFKDLNHLRGGCRPQAAVALALREIPVPLPTGPILIGFSLLPLSPGGSSP